MKTPVCDICRLTPIKCAVCEDRMNKGELSEADFDVSRAMSAAKSSIQLEKAFDLGSVYVGAFKGETTPALKEALGRDLYKVSDGKGLLDALGIRATPSKVFVNGEERVRVALPKAELVAMSIDPLELKRALDYFKLEASII